MSDLISRGEALKALLKVPCKIDSDKYAWIRLSDAFGTVDEDVPSAEPEHKKGEWVDDCCSCCGVSKYNYIKMVDDECGPFGTWNFCPNCGARLEWE